MSPPILSPQWLRQATGQDIITFFKNVPVSLKAHDNYAELEKTQHLLEKMIKWLDNNPRDVDRRLADKIKDTLLHTPGITNKSFKHAYLNFSCYINTVLYVAEEEYLDDNAISLLLKTLKNRHSDGGRNMFIDQDFLRAAIECKAAEGEHMLFGSFKWDWGKKDLFNNVVDRAFGIYNHAQHWYVVCIDFQARQVFAGDSIDRGMPEHVRRAIVQWLVSVLPVTNEFSQPSDSLKGWTLHKLDVPQQGGDSGSCGLVAANAIECILDPRMPPWSRQKRVAHRMRLLNMLMSDNPFVSTY